MNKLKFAAGTLISAMSGLAFAGTAVSLGGAVHLPILEGGMLSMAVVGLMVGVRVIQRKNKR